jgi:hypothetical protein
VLVATEGEDSVDLSFPDPADVQAHAEVVLTDATLLWNALQAAHQGGTLGYGLTFEGWQGIGPSGGVSGGLLRARVSLTIEL